MIALDTNIVVRLLTQDDEKQFKKAEAAITRIYNEGNLCYVNCVVLVETCWVLEKAYNYSKTLIVKAFELLLQLKELEIQYTDEVWHALKTSQESNIGFADAYIGLINKKENCTYTLTFDKKAAATKDFQLL